jgi:hypothetical protein
VCVGGPYSDGMNLASCSGMVISLVFSWCNSYGMIVVLCWLCVLIVCCILFLLFVFAKVTFVLLFLLLVSILLVCTLVSILSFALSLLLLNRDDTCCSMSVSRCCMR